MNQLLSLAVPTVLICAVSSTAIADDLETRIKNVAPSHPRLFFTEEQTAPLKAKIEGNPVLKSTLEFLVKSCDAMLDEKPVTRKKTGKRLLGVSRTALNRVSYLAFAYRMTGKQAYLKHAEQEMLAAAAFDDWNPSHFLDVGEMTAALAIGYDWLYNDLSEGSRETIKAAIIGKGLNPGMKGGWWVFTTNNWNQVCHGGLTLGALAVLEDEPELANDIIARAIENVPRAMREYRPDGVYPEGPGYWKYGTSYNIVFISALESVLGADFGLSSSEGFMETPEFYLHATGPTGLYFNFSDCGTRGGIAPAMHWFAQRANDPSLLWREKGELDRYAARDVHSAGSGDRLLPFLLIWGQPAGSIPAPKKLYWKGDGRTPVAMFRSAWTEDATYLAIKGGSPGTNHAHMDIGSFVLDMMGERWSVDLGSQSYNSLESKGIDLWNRRQDSERWTVFRLNNTSHSTLVVDGKHQLVKGHAPIVQFSESPKNPHAIVNMLPVYEGQLARAMRGARMVGESSVLIQDELKALDRKTAVRWGMTTNAKVTLTAGNAATLEQHGKAVTLKVLAPAGVELTVLDFENPPQSYDYTNPNTRMVAFEAVLDASASETLAIFISPAGSPGGEARVKPLESW